MDTKKPRVQIDQAKCTPCSQLICIGSCPTGVLELDEKSKPQVVEESACTQCGICESHCPQKAITVPKAKAK